MKSLLLGEGQTATVHGSSRTLRGASQLSQKSKCLRLSKAWFLDCLVVSSAKASGTLASSASTASPRVSHAVSMGSARKAGARPMPIFLVDPSVTWVPYKKGSECYHDIAPIYNPVPMPDMAPLA